MKYRIVPVIHDKVYYKVEKIGLFSNVSLKKLHRFDDYAFGADAPFWNEAWFTSIKDAQKVIKEQFGTQFRQIPFEVK